MKRILLLTLGVLMLSVVSMPDSRAQNWDNDVGWLDKSTTELKSNIDAQNYVADATVYEFKMLDSLIKATYDRKIYDNLVIANVPGLDVTWARWRLMSIPERAAIIEYIDKQIIRQMTAFRNRHYEAIDARLCTEIKYAK